jgi:hypothetical protein
MTSNLTNNIISNLTLINSDNNNEINNQIDLKTIVNNAKNDKTFHKLLIICIKYDIHLFNQSKNNYSLLTIDNLLEQINNKQNIFILELSNEIKNINNEWLINIDNFYNIYKKKLKDLELISYILKNIFNNNLLQKLCCISNTDNSTENILSPIQKDITLIDKKKKENISKYIAVYSN